MKKVLSLEELLLIRECLKAEGKTVVLTNGHFDILHVGHVDCLQRAKALGDVLIVGLNSDASLRRLKGPGRPLVMTMPPRAATLRVTAFRTGSAM